VPTPVLSLFLEERLNMCVGCGDSTQHGSALERVDALCGQPVLPLVQQLPIHSRHSLRIPSGALVSSSNHLIVIRSLILSL